MGCHPLALKTGFMRGRVNTKALPNIKKKTITRPFIHSFIMHSVNPYKVNQTIGYRVCHDANVI